MDVLNDLQSIDWHVLGNYDVSILEHGEAKNSDYRCTV
jgi:hypothetical protein